MGNGGYNQQFQHQNLHFNHHNRRSFLTMLCSKPSIKDVVVTFPKWRDRSSSSLASFSDDPLSPKISCMGQVKRNNKILGLPAASRQLHVSTTKNRFNNGNKYFKLKKLFSGKNLTSSPAATATAAVTNTTASCRRKQALALIKSGRNRPKNDGGKENSGSINIENMDPPLPVIKRVPKQGDHHKRDGDTLWQRRSRSGVSLKSLQLQQIQLNRHQEPTTV